MIFFEGDTYSEYWSGRSQNKHDKPQPGEQVSGPESPEEGTIMATYTHADMQLIDLNVHSPDVLD
jgi:hypothetical protein